MVSRFCIASHAYSRSARGRSAPKLLDARSRWPPLPRRANSSSHPVGATQPRACACSQPPTVCIHIFPSLPARTDGSSGSFPVVENQICKARQLRRA
eukprot:3734693-Pleurochrysis_carterae.AAC.3